MTKRSRKGNKKVLLGAIILTLYVLAVAVGPYVWKVSPYKINLTNALANPSWAHPFGTDALGRDLLARVLHGARYSFALCLTAMGIATSLGLVLGVMASYHSGTWLDHLIMGAVDVVLSVPVVIMAIVIVSVVTSRLGGLICALIAVYTPTMTRLARSKALVVKEATYIEAAVAIGASRKRVLMRHILPNACRPVVAESVLRFAESVILVSALSYIGLGVNPPTPEWGVLLRHAMEYMSIAPHILFFTGGALALLVLGINILSEGLMEDRSPTRS